MKINLLELSGLKEKEIAEYLTVGQDGLFKGYNKALKDLSTIDIELDREELAESIFQHEKIKFGYGSKTLQEASNNPRNPGFGDIFYTMADSIISNSNKIIKVVKK